MLKQYVLFTNNSSKSPVDYSRGLQRKGCNVEGKVLTTADVAAYYYHQNYENQNIYLVGTDALGEYLRQKGVSITTEDAKAVFVSFDKSFTYEKMRLATAFINKGADYVATHMDLTCPVEEGMIPDCGSICASITAATGVNPVMLGKPNSLVVDVISNITGVEPENITFVGDRLSTDIMVSKERGAKSILTLEGDCDRGKLEKSDIKPDFVYDSINALLHDLKGTCE
ncbi:MAG: HAD-IIA family hydrolase [Pseudobutyrivibrio sp.]|nr:HAD-IIA family hydrolase [Pseudobutyrivibrio sp.]